MKTFEDEVRSVIDSNPNPPYNKAQALRLYAEKTDLDALVGVDMNRYQEALEATGGAIGGVEPISRFHEAFQGPVDAAYAAAVVGLETETFLERIRENTGLQNVGLLALENTNGSVQRDTWTSSFRDVMYALDYPRQVGEPPVITQPDVIPGTQVHIPDPILRAAVSEGIRRSPNVPITVGAMKRLRRLDLAGKGVRDLTGLQYATNLTWLHLPDNQVSDLSPIAGLTELRELWAHGNLLSDISPVRGLTNLTHLEFDQSQVSDISSVKNLTKLTWLEFDNSLVSDISFVRGLTNLTRLEIQGTLVSDLSPVTGLNKLKHLDLGGTNVSDLSPVAGLINLEFLGFSNDTISDISALAGLINLKHIHTWGNPFSDLSPLAKLNKLERLDICGAKLSDLSPLAGLNHLKELYLAGNGITDVSALAGLRGLLRLGIEGNKISDISPIAGMRRLRWLNLHDNIILDVSTLAGLTHLTWLSLHRNEITDISAIAGLTHLTWLDAARNKISDLSPLEELRQNLTFLAMYDNPGFRKGGPKIEGPWLWVFLPDTRLDDTDLLSEASGGKVTELGVAMQGATVGNPVGADEWTSHNLPITGRHNLDDMLGRTLPDGVIYGTASLYSPRRQGTTMYLGSDQEVKVWLNGALVYNRQRIGNGGDYTDFFHATLEQGKNILLVAAGTRSNDPSNLFIGFETGIEYTVASGIGYAFSETPVHIGDTFTLDIRADNVSDFAGWQFDITFDPAALEAVDVSEGDFLKTDGGSTFFQEGSIDNASGKITGLSAALLSAEGVTGTGSLLQVRFKAKSPGEIVVTLANLEFGSIAGEEIPTSPNEIIFFVEGQLAIGDVNRDGVVSILDLIRVAQQLGKRVSPDSPEDVNGDGIVNIFDLTLVAQGIGGAAAPAIKRVDNERDRDLIEAWIALARLADDGSIAFRQGIANLLNLLASLIIPQETALHANYPNPFNPETWIPYQLAVPSEVTLTIYDMNGGTVRRLDVGHQQAGLYQSRSRAAYWDGRNHRGESVASGLYFYTLRAGEFAATRKMLIRK